MNQYQNRSTEEQKTFLSKIKDNYSAKFGNLSITSSIQKASSYVDKDGSSETETLIHKAFVKYFDSKGEPYPEWLGVPAPQASNSRSTYQSYGQSSTGSSSQYKPVYTSYNAPRSNSSPSQVESRSLASPTPPATTASASTYQSRSSSRLQDMYNKSRQQHVPAAGYTTVNEPTRTNSSTSGSRLRERMMKSGSMTGMSNVVNDGSRASWGKRQG